MDRQPLHALDPTTADDRDHLVVLNGEVKPFPFRGVIILEHGQTLTAWLAANGLTELPEDTVLIELGS